MKNVADALDYLDKDYLVNASIIEPIKNGTVDILYASNECAYVKDKLTDVFMLATEDLELADSLLKGFDMKCALVVHNDSLCAYAIKKFGFDSNVPCYQAVYRGRKFEEPVSDITVRLMRESEAKDAAAMYRFDEAEALRHIRRGLVYGAYGGGETVGMIGMHMQGSMGLLEVKNEYRRKGYAQVMEKFLINSLLDKGLVPYCQIVDDNTASLSLQRKLGLDISDGKLYWLHKKQ